MNDCVWRSWSKTFSAYINLIKSTVTANLDVKRSRFRGKCLPVKYLMQSIQKEESSDTSNNESEK